MQAGKRPLHASGNVRLRAYHMLACSCACKRQPTTKTMQKVHPAFFCFWYTFRDMDARVWHCGRESQQRRTRIGQRREQSLPFPYIDDHGAELGTNTVRSVPGSWAYRPAAIYLCLVKPRFLTPLGAAISPVPVVWCAWTRRFMPGIVHIHTHTRFQSYSLTAGKTHRYRLFSALGLVYSTRCLLVIMLIRALRSCFPRPFT